MGFQLVQDVAVFGVSVDGSEVHVGVYGGPDHVCASVTFDFPEPFEREANASRLRRWERAGTPLSLCVTGETVRLFSERAMFRRIAETAFAE